MSVDWRAAEPIERAMAHEVYRALRLPTADWRRGLLAPLLRQPVARAARLALDFENRVADGGFCEASRWLLTQLNVRTEAREAPLFPREGSFILASNHPGSVDVFVLAAQLRRRDVRFVARDMPLLRALPATSACMIYSTRDMTQRMVTLRQALRHVEGGGALLLFPSGNLDPDPAYWPGALEALNTWTGSLELFLRRLPETQLALAAVGRAVSPGAVRHPFTRLRRRRWDRQFMAELVQIVSLLLAPGRGDLRPVVGFSDVLRPAEWMAAGGVENLREEVLRRAIHLQKRNFPELPLDRNSIP